MKSIIKSFLVRHLAAILIGILIIAAFFTTGGMISSIRANLDSFRIITSPTAITSQEVLAVAIGEQYIVKEYDGRIGVFIPGDTQPIQVLQVYVIYLPESDRTKLREGIIVNGNESLNVLLDDFRS